MKRFILMLGVVLAFSSVGTARTLSVDEARSAAARFVLSNAPSLQRAPSVNFASQLSVAYTARSTANAGNALYVFNIADDGGFVVASADDCAPAVLGFSLNGTFNYDELPCNFKWWLDEYVRQISYMQSIGATSAPRKLTLPKNVNVLLPDIHWKQRTPYNDQCPLYNSTDHCLAGCVAIATGQIMRYYKHPLQGTGYHSYKTLINNTGDTVELSCNLANSTYNWNNILPDYSGYSTPTQRSAVAKLVSDIGIAEEMKYGASASATSSRKVTPALVNHFSYDKGAILIDRDYYPTDDNTWEMILYNELLNGRPVYYAGETSTKGAHAFVIDGCRTDGYFHVNWGWGPTYDSYFLLTALDPYAQGDGGSTGGYNYRQSMTTGIKPDAGGPMGYFGFMKSMEVKEPVTGTGLWVYFKVNRYNVHLSTGEPANVFLGVATYDANDNLLRFRTTQEATNLDPAFVWTWELYYWVPTDLPDGQYKLRMGFSFNSNTDFLPFHIYNTEAQYITMTLNNGTASFSLDPITPVSLFGDVNNDTFVNVTDVNLLVSAVLNHTKPAGYDLSGDGEVNVTDINLCVSAILKNK